MECHPRVLIVGAGIGGLLLAIQLQRAGVDYEIFERAEEIKPLGSAMVTGPNILPVFEQLGLLDQVEKISKPLKCLKVYNGSLEELGTVDANSKERAGYHSMVFERKNLYALLLSQVPPHKIHRKKKVLSMREYNPQDEQDRQHPDFGVMIRCSDNSSYYGDILVGADGAYSAVRQSLFRQLAAQNVLPKQDSEDLSMRHICLVGTTKPLDPAQYPCVQDEHSHFEIVLAKDTTESVACFTVPDNKICFIYTVQLNTNPNATGPHASNNPANERFRNSEWGPEAAAALSEQIRHVRAPFGLTMGDLLDVTPKGTVTKVMLEEKLFETWHHGRTVLIGDACHKMLPSAGQGAINAMQDATILANCINDLKSLKPQTIANALKDYQHQRYNYAKAQFETSKRFAVIMSGQSWTEAVIRKLVLGYLPKSLNQRRQDKTCAYRPQLNFLQPAPEKGIIPVLPQVPSKRYSIDASAL
ncbi:hypothetical protein BGZ83_008197 [Gryganskiella cystojenkinii]|nr:hypothetical protein BGZ83_008197 [Gryganskiella cystojenkinii]